MSTLMFILMTVLPMRIQGEDREYIIALSLGETSWNEGSVYCADTYETSLATVITEGDKTNIFNALEAAGIPAYPFLIGLNDIDNDGEFKWEDGTSCEFDASVCAEDTPVCCVDYWSFPPKAGFCAVGDIHTEDGFDIMADDCSYVSFTAACNKPDTDIGVGRKYAIVPNFEGDVYAAQAACNETYGSTLATVVTDLDLRNLPNRVNFEADQCWIGLHDRNTEGVFEWDDGSECSHTEPLDEMNIPCVSYWDPYRPSNSGRCVVERGYGLGDLPAIWSISCDANVNCVVCNVESVPTLDPTKDPTRDPTEDPTQDPTRDPTKDPTKDPTSDPTTYPTRDPTADPTRDPTTNPTKAPTRDPTKDPTRDPTEDPTHNPTKDPTKDPTRDPTKDPTADPTKDPTLDPTDSSESSDSSETSAHAAFPPLIESQPESAITSLHRNGDHEDIIKDWLEHKVFGGYETYFYVILGLTVYSICFTMLVLSLRGSNCVKVHRKVKPDPLFDSDDTDLENML